MTKNTPTPTFVCPICDLSKPAGEGRPAVLVHGPVGELIRQEHPDWDENHLICQSCLNRFRMDYVEGALKTQRGGLTTLEEAVIDSLKDQGVLARNVDAEYAKALTFGDRLSDRIAAFGGSWRFIIIFMAILAVWIIINSYVLLARPFDPYPFILLNLVLSCVAAMQAPVIMMSQNRQEEKDRLRAEHDYQVNLKAEIEIRQLHIKLDQMINQSWQRLLEIQQIQLDMMEDLANRSRPDAP
ncbi:MAG: DUF1003 domain-containing protein [candidate division Zixibacteria bacterium]|nr:DUF1003 domain-containing protein [candidate division Zixibacteria bacterium]